MSRKISDFFKSTPIGSRPFEAIKPTQIKIEAEVNLEINFDDVDGLKSTFNKNSSKILNNQASFDSKNQLFIPNVIKIEPKADKESIQMQSMKYPAIKEEPIEKLQENIKTEPEKEFLIILTPKSNQTKTKNPIKQHQCSICSLKFKQAKGLTTHIKRSHNFGQQGSYECDFDGKIITQKMSLRAHMKSHELEVKCKICGQEMKVLSMKDHMKAVHSDERKYKCKICSKSFKLPSVLRNHLLSHDKKFECKVCGKKVRNGQDLKFHVNQVHVNPRSFKCEICEKGFFDKGNFKKHQKTHDKNREKAYKCYRCNYSDDNKAHYKKHQNYHAKCDAKISKAKNPVKCTKCLSMFIDQVRLNIHMSAVHPKVLFQCDLCAMYSKTKSNFEKHMRLVHLKNKK